MDGTVAEGISTSLQTCPTDPQRLHFGDLPSPPSKPHLHVNDLGLTPTPGSQLQQPTDVTRASSPDEICDGNPERTPDGSRQVCTDGLEDLFSDKDGVKPHEEQGDTLSTRDADPTNHHHVENSPNTQDTMSTTEGRHNSKQDGHPDIFSVPADMDKAFFFDPLFDSESVLREIDAVFESRKRRGAEAFPGEFDFWGNPEKRRFLATPASEQCTSPDETPSLSSADSCLRPDQAENTPHTPAGTERAKSPNSLFDSLDTLFEDPGFGMSLESHGDGLPDFDIARIISETEMDTNQMGNFGLPEHSVEPYERIEENVDLAQPCTSEATKQQFSLEPQDILASTNRQVMQRVYQPPEYTSPYPAYGGPLGYFPSAPSVHVKYIEATDDRVNYRMTTLRDRIQQLTSERNRYKAAWFQWTTLDPETGKTKEQLLREENAMLRRVNSQHQNRVEQYKKEAAEWKGKLRELGTTHNNLLYEINVQRQMPAVTPIPSGYKPPRRPVVYAGHFLPLNPQGGPPAGQQQQAPMPATPVHGPVSGERPGHNFHHPQISSVAPATSQLSMRPASGESRPEPVTIDLTETGDDTTAEAKPSPEKRRQQLEMLQSLRNKKYEWLNDSERSRSITPAMQTPQPEDAARSHSPGSSLDDELARAMEAELADG